MYFNNVSVILGQYMGVTLLILISSLAYLFKFIIPPTYIALFGILPIIIGLKGLWSLKQDAPKDLLNESFTQNSLGNNELLNSEVSIYKIFKVASITFSNGGDNIGVYAPLFASMSIFPLIFTLIIFMLMIGLWCFIGYLMVRNRIVGNKLKRYGHIILPFVLILIGFGVLLGGGSIFSLNY
jgi:cadmium resistance protein CadD (predicted permease)